MFNNELAKFCHYYMGLSHEIASCEKVAQASQRLYMGEQQRCEGGGRGSENALEHTFLYWGLSFRRPKESILKGPLSSSVKDSMSW